jgi:hypothetical protein
MAARKKDPVITGADDVGPELLAKAIVDVADAAKALLKSRLTKKAILVLLKDKTGLPQHTIESVLDGAARLDEYVKR